MKPSPPNAFCGWAIKSAWTPVSNISSIVPRIEAANTAATVISATPIIRAEAAAAVRRGLRTVFSWASLPVMLDSRANGAASHLVSNGAASGLNVVTPRTVRRAASPTVAITGWPGSPMSAKRVPKRSPIPRTRSPAPNMARFVSDPRRLGVASARIASTGATRLALLAGINAEIKVTPVPTRIATTTVRRESCSEVEGRDKPAASSSDLSPIASNRPSPTPITDAAVPTINASTRTIRVTWRPVAPNARSSASSRVRCATMIVKVL